MSFATAYSRALLGVNALEVVVETHLSRGLPGFSIVGLPATAVRESKERVRSAIINAGMEFPSHRITVNLAPADLPKTGGKYDLAIALSILAASGQLDKAYFETTEILGELSLDGRIRGIAGIVPAILAAKRSGRRLLLPEENFGELCLVNYEAGMAASNLVQVIAHLCQGQPLRQVEPGFARVPAGDRQLPSPHAVKGQAQAKRALQIAAGGAHHMMMVGPPGSGKTLLANCLVALLPALEEDQALELAGLRSVLNLDLSEDHWYTPPLRAPHHSCTAIALLGGGQRAMPGDISLANHGVLFLDELTEFTCGVLDSLREPLESGEIHISRANYRVRYPARFQLIAAMNPCPCGYASAAQGQCQCAPERIRRYLGKLSGPLLDRLDLIVEVPGLSSAELLQQESEATDWRGIRAAVAQCRQTQQARAGKTNAAMSSADVEAHCVLSDSLRSRMAKAMDKLGLSARAAHGLLRVARTIADYEQRPEISEQDIFEAMSFRSMRLFRSAAARF